MKYLILAISQFLEKIQKHIRKLPKRFANCKLRMANYNSVMFFLFARQSQRSQKIEPTAEVLHAQVYLIGIRSAICPGLHQSYFKATVLMTPL